MASLDPDTFAGALLARLTRLTPPQRRLMLAQAIRLLAGALPRLTPAQRQAVAVQVAVALDAAGYPYDALLVRLALLGHPPPASAATDACQPERRGRDWRMRAQ